MQAAYVLGVEGVRGGAGMTDLSEDIDLFADLLEQLMPDEQPSADVLESIWQYRR